MAYTKEQWEKAKAYYEAGLSLSKIKDKTGIARNTISQRAKREQWEQGKNSDYIETKVKLMEQKGTVLEQSGTVALTIADDIADEKIRRRNLVLGNAELLASKVPSIVESYTVEQEDKETGKVKKIFTMPAKELKELAEANDKIGVTLEVAPRHANSQINIQNTNAQQTNANLNIEDMTQKEISDTYLDMIKKK